jgi:hypothetical protein
VPPASRLRARILPLLAVAAVAAAAAEARAQSAPTEDWRIERVDLAEKLADGAAVEVENRFGDLRVRSGGTGELAVHGVSQRAAGEPALRVELAAAGRGWVVRVVEPDATQPREGPARRVDLAVAVPADSPLTLRGAGGLVEARGFRAPLSARTSTGEIRLRGSGAIDARSERGAIRVAFHPEAPGAPSRLETTTGAIEVELPAGAGAEARLETRGSLTTDYSLTVERVGPLSKRAGARIGAGGPEIRLTSLTGDLRLLERPPASR